MLPGSTTPSPGPATEAQTSPTAAAVPAPDTSVGEPGDATPEPLTVTLSPEASAALRSFVGATGTHEALTDAADTLLRESLHVHLDEPVPRASENGGTGGSGEEAR